MKTTSKDKYKGRIPTEAERKRSGLIDDIFGPFILYFAAMFTLGFALSGPSTSNSIIYGVVIGGIALFFTYYALKTIIQNRKMWQGYYFLVWGIIGFWAAKNDLLLIVQ